MAVVELCPAGLTFASASIPVISTEPTIALKAGAIAIVVPCADTKPLAEVIA